MLETPRPGSSDNLLYFNWLLVVVLVLIIPSVLEAEDAEDFEDGAPTGENEGHALQERRARDPARAPNLIVGVSTGYAHHFGTATQIDAVTSASMKISDRSFSDPGLGLGVFLDFGFLDIGPGNLGLTAAFLTSVPTLHLEVGLSLRYRMRFTITGRRGLRAIEPFIGFSTWFAWRENQFSDFYLLIGPSLGIDFEIGIPGLYVGLGLDINVVDLVPVTTPATIGEEQVDIEWRLDDVVGLVRLGYRLF